MRKLCCLGLVLVIVSTLVGCGVSVPQVAEVWDRAVDPLATQHMQMQVKRAVYCELRDAIWIARRRSKERYFAGNRLTTVEDGPLPDTWGAQITFKFTVDETSKLTPGASFITPMPNVVTNFGGGRSISSPESFTLGFGGTLSSQATRVDTFETFYAIRDVATVLSDNNICDRPNLAVLGPDSRSSPLVVESRLGIREWLPQAVEVGDFLKSSRADETGAGPPLGGSAAKSSDSISYNIKYIIITSANVSPVWKLVRLNANTSSSLYDANRTRTHELIITIGPANLKLVRTKNGVVVTEAGPTPAAQSSHFAQQIGSSIAAALRPQ